jgi:hypothetical protein
MTVPLLLLGSLQRNQPTQRLLKKALELRTRMKKKKMLMDLLHQVEIVQLTLLTTQPQSSMDLYQNSHLVSAMSLNRASTDPSQPRIREDTTPRFSLNQEFNLRLLLTLSQASMEPDHLSLVSPKAV